MKTATGFGLFLFLAVLCPAAADFNQIKTLYESIHTTDDSALAQKQEAIASLEGDIKALTPDEILAPYVDDLGSMLTASEPGIRKGAVYLLGATQPAPSPKALGWLVAHVSDKNNSADEFRVIAAAILESRPSDAGTIHLVLALVEQRPELKMKPAVIHMLGLYRITTDEALQFIRSGLNGDNHHLRQSSIDAVERLPREARDAFALDLQRIANDTTESPEVRSMAANALNPR